MGAIAMAIIYLGYSVDLWGYCLITGKNVSLLQLVNPLHVINWQQIGPAGNTVVFPNGTPASAVNASGGGGGSGDSGGGPVSAAGIQNSRAIHAAAARDGWGSGGQWNAITHLIAGESGGNSTIANQSSGALGVGQALGHGTSDTAGTLGNEYGPIDGDWLGMSPTEMRAANSGDAYWQSVWTMGYIKQVYGTPAAAYNKWLSRNPHWY